MKRYIILFFALTLIMVISFLFVFKDTKPVIICSSLDHSIRPRNYCLMNPFRDRKPERLADELLIQMRSGNTEIIQTYVADENKQRVRENEQIYRISNWRIGDRTDQGNRVDIMYWVTRENYRNETTGEDHVEAVSFFFIREADELKLETYTASY